MGIGLGIGMGIGMEIGTFRIAAMRGGAVALAPSIDE